MTTNAYVDLTAQSLRALCALAQQSTPQALEEAQALWSLLALTDGQVDPREHDVYTLLNEEARALGLQDLKPLPPTDFSERPLPEFLRLAAIDDLRHAGRIVNQLEAFGYGLIAADREIREDEHAALKGYLSKLRNAIVEAHEAALKVPATVAN